MNEHGDQTPKPWDRQAGETLRWYSRFCRYRLLGPTRSVMAAWKAEQAEKGRERPTATNAPTSWRNAAQRWEWRHRAEQWDAVELERTEREAQRIRDERRRALVDFEWRQARMLAEFGERCFSEAGAMPALGKRRSIRDEPIEQTTAANVDGETAVAIEKLILETDGCDLLKTGKALMEAASTMARRAVAWPTNFKPADVNGEAKANSQPQTIIFDVKTRDMSGRPAHEMTAAELASLSVDVDEADLENMTTEQLAALSVRLMHEELANMSSAELREYRANLAPRRNALDAEGAGVG